MKIYPKKSRSTKISIRYIVEAQIFTKLIYQVKHTRFLMILSKHAFLRVLLVQNFRKHQNLLPKMFINIQFVWGALTKKITQHTKLALWGAMLRLIEFSAPTVKNSRSVTIDSIKNIKMKMHKNKILFQLKEYNF